MALQAVLYSGMNARYYSAENTDSIYMAAVQICNITQRQRSVFVL